GLTFAQFLLTELAIHRIGKYLGDETQPGLDGLGPLARTTSRIEAEYTEDRAASHRQGNCEGGLNAEEFPALAIANSLGRRFRGVRQAHRLIGLELAQRPGKELRSIHVLRRHGKFR